MNIFSQLNNLNYSRPPLTPYVITKTPEELEEGWSKVLLKKDAQDFFLDIFNSSVAIDSTSKLERLDEEFKQANNYSALSLASFFMSFMIDTKRSFLECVELGRNAITNKGILTFIKTSYDLPDTLNELLEADSEVGLALAKQLEVFFDLPLFDLEQLYQYLNEQESDETYLVEDVII